MKKTFFITTAIDYPSAPPHIGHAYEKIIADTIARYKRLKGFKVYFCTGTDEHGQKIQKAADAAGKSPQKFVDDMSKLFLNLCERLNISYDDFFRTTEKRHETVVNRVYRKMLDKGDIYKSIYSGLYCVECETYWLEKDLQNGNCPTHSKPPTAMSEESYFFKMSAYQQKLIDHIKSNPNFIYPSKKAIEILNRLSEPLKDLSISRTTLKWGIQLPSDKKHVFYVWLDALTYYLSTLDYPNKKYKEFWPCDVHIIGPDIVWHHTVIWGSELLSAGVPLPKQVCCHGFINDAEGRKMSKLLGNVIDPIEILDKFGSEALRYYLLREIPFGEDGNFSVDALKTRYTSDLANDLGNLLNRAIVMAEKYFDGKIPKASTFKTIDNEIIATSKKTSEEVDKLFEKYDFMKALSETWQFVGLCNKYVNDTKPWELAKSDVGRLKTVLYVLFESLRIISVLIAPVLPESSAAIRKQLSLPQKFDFDSAKAFGQLKPGTTVKKGPLLFEKKF